MIDVRSAGSRGQFQNEWLESRFSFSFADYYDPAHMGFGHLRVLNEDWIQPRTGFEPHPHRDMEIVTAVLEGAVEHRDSSGGHGVIEAGQLQVMSAGTGVVHSERNPASGEVLHLLQIWIVPDRRGLAPRYDQRSFVDLPRGSFVPVVSGGEVPGTLHISQDVVLCLAKLEAGMRAARPLGPSRRAYLHVIDGQVRVGNLSLSAGDAVKITAGEEIGARADTDARLLLFDLP